MADYYVNSEAADDNGDGSIGDPWKYITTHVDDLSAGDTMHVRGNISLPARTYDEAPIDIDGTNGASSGTSGNPITMCNYQDEHVIWQCNTSEFYPFALHDVNYWTIDGLKLNAQDKNCEMLLLDTVTHVTISNCEIYDGTYYAADISRGDDCIIEYCIIHDFVTGPGNDAHGIILSRGSNNTFRNNTIYDCTGDCIRLWPYENQQIINTIIEDNRLYTTLGLCSENGVDVGRMPAGTCTIVNTTIRRNTLHGFRYNDGSCAGSGGGVGEAITVWASTITDGVLIEDNEIYDCTTGIKANCPNVEIVGNCIHDMHSDALSWLSAGIFVWGCTGAQIYNNTFDELPEHLYYLGATAYNVLLRNNLAYRTHDITVETGGTYDADYNGWFDCVDTLAGAHDTTGGGDPGFVDAAGDDYRLVSTSTAIDAGVDVGLDYYGDAPDLGYWEYEPLIPPIAVLREPGASLYKLRLKSAAGVLIAEIIDFEELCYAKRVNHPGLLTFKLDGDHAVISLLEHKSQVEVWRSNPNQQLDWHCDFYGLHLRPDHFQSERNVFTTVCPGQMWLLGTRHIAWYAATANRTRFTGAAAETIMKTLVDYNACANATTGNNRLRNGAITGLSIQADSARGNSLDWNCAWRNLLTVLQEVALVAGGDFDLIKTAAQEWEFRWYTGQRGNDRSSAVVFARERGNMINPRYRHDRIGEKTVAIIGGQGEQGDRDAVIRTGDDYSAGNDVEVFVDARNCTTTAGYNAAGDKRLDELRARKEFSFEVVQTPSCFYGEVASGGDYELGDLITARAFGIEQDQKVVGVTVTVVPAADHCEVIDIEVETP